MLREIPRARQIAGEPKRRWFTNDSLDLYIWQQDKNMVGFQLSYAKGTDEHLISWKQKFGFHHQAVDDGEQRVHKAKATPLRIANGSFDIDKIKTGFLNDATSLDLDIFEFIMRKLVEFKFQMTGRNINLATFSG